MLYCKTITVPANTSKENFVEETIEIEEDTLFYVEIRFPPGPCGLLYISVYYGDLQLLPSTKGEWARGDNERVWDVLLFELPEKPSTIRIRGYNLDDTYSHSAIIRIVALPKEVALFMRAISRLEKIISLFFEKVIGFRG